jgi:hypothetical protein
MASVSIENATTETATLLAVRLGATSVRTGDPGFMEDSEKVLPYAHQTHGFAGKTTNRIDEGAPAGPEIRHQSEWSSRPSATNRHRTDLQFLFPRMSGTKPTVVQDQGLEWFCGGAANNPRQASGAVGRVPDICGDKPLALPPQKPRVCELSAVFLGADD